MGGYSRAAATKPAGSSLNLLVSLLLLLFAGTLLLSFRSAGQRKARPRKGYVYVVAEPPDEATQVSFPPKEPAVLALEADVRERHREALQVRCEGQSIPFMLVTAERPDGCKTEKGCQTIMKSYKNKVDYCNLHGCKVWYSLETWVESLPGTWARYPLLKSLMEANPGIPWFLWMDADALFTDMSFSIPLSDYDDMGKNLVLNGVEDKVYGDNPSWTGLNAGIFLIRNCDWSKEFLDQWMGFGNPQGAQHVTEMLNKELPDRPQDWVGDDQSSLVHLLREKRKNAYGENDYSLLESRFSLHGYWVNLVPQFEKWQATGNKGEAATADEKWPFITHFVGCKLCSGLYASSSEDECFHNFDRAFTFADNQILSLAKMEHARLGRQRVRLIPGSDSDF